MTWIKLDGAVNVRDVGGLPLVDGGVTAEGRLIRADNLQELSAADVARLVDEIGLTTVVDLRSTAELTAVGPAPLDAVEGVRHVHLPVLPEAGLATDMIADVFVVRDEQDLSRYPGDRLTGHYLGYLEDRPDQVIAAIRLGAGRLILAEHQFLAIGRFDLLVEELDARQPDADQRQQAGAEHRPDHRGEHQRIGDGRRRIGNSVTSADSFTSTGRNASSVSTELMRLTPRPSTVVAKRMVSS